MMRSWMIAAACAVALGVTGCSGNNAAAPTAPTDPADPADPAPDGGTGDGNGGSDGEMPEEMAFDTKLGEAETALTAAQEQVMTAEAAAAAADTDEARETAQAAIARARRALTNAVNAANALRALAPDGDNERRGRAEAQIRRATEAQTSAKSTLDAADRSVVVIGWSGRASLSTRTIRTEVEWVGTFRKAFDDYDILATDDGADLDTALTWDKIPAVMYEAGKIVMRPGRDSSGDRLRMRGLPVIRGTNSAGFVDRSGNPGNAVTTATNGYFDEIVAGLTVTDAGLAVHLADRFKYPSADIKIMPRRAVSFRTDEQFGANRFDLALTFGRPSPSPTGNAEHYWTATLMPNDVQLAAPATWSNGIKDSSGLGLPLGDYHVRLSNHLREDKRLEPTDGGTDPSDDRNFYLSYAAYGLFDFVPSSNVSVDGSDYARMIPFAAGYDAFKNADGMKVTDVAEADKITAGKFKGQTIAETLVVSATAGSLGPQRFLHPSTDSDAWMLRGDIELTATISGTAGDNKVEGTLSNMEQWDTGTNRWKNFEYFRTASLGEGSIGDDGSFSGPVPIPAGSAGFRAGFYKGNFYGPLSDLEAAGSWALPYGVGGSRVIVGSFGAALVRDDDTYGHCIGSSCP